MVVISFKEGKVPLLVNCPLLVGLEKACRHVIITIV
jgi:hypothetical protein